MNKCILALDQGTTSSRAIIFKNGIPISSAQHELKQIYPQPGYVEHNPYDIWNTQLISVREAVMSAGIDISDIAAVGITNQRETVILWDRKTGEPVYNAIVWQCRRTASICEDLINSGLSDMIRQKTGLVIDAYFSAAKLKWLFDNIPLLRERAVNGEIAFGTPDTWLIWKLTGGKYHVTDPTNASRTMLFNINTFMWDDELLRLFGVPREILPEIVPSSGIIGETSIDFLGKPIPVSGIAGDQQAALYGQGCYSAGSIKNTYGTGCFTLMNTGKNCIVSKNGLISTVVCDINGKSCYGIEGSVFSAGSAVQWLRDGLGIIKTASESEALALSVDSSEGVYFVPAFTGLGAPHWNMHSRALTCGITRSTTKAHLTRAVLESIAFQTYDIICAMEADTGQKIEKLRVDGGASANNFLMSFQADILGVPAERPACIESTALGAAKLAALAVGEVIDDSNNENTKIYNPSISHEKRKMFLEGWREAVNKCLYNSKI